MLIVVTMTSKRMVSVGQRFRDARSGAFGRPRIVEEIFTGTDGLEYAHVACIADRSLRKTLSAAVLNDSTRFCPV
jgi:hypothetical protein